MDRTFPLFNSMVEKYARMKIINKKINMYLQKEYFTAYPLLRGHFWGS